MSGEMCPNIVCSESLLGGVKKHKVNGKQAKSHDIHLKMNQNDIPELPAYKVNQKPMCLAWHTKGMCNPTCHCAADHVKYTDAEFSALAGWCREHYPKSK